MSKQREEKRVGIVGRNLRRYRDRLGISQVTLAEKAGISRGAIADLERGQSQSPDEATVRALAGALGVSPADLWVNDSHKQSEVSEVAPRVQVGDAGLAPGLAGFLDRHLDDLSPREIRELKSFSFSLAPGYSPDEEFWARILSAIRLRISSQGS